MLYYGLIDSLKYFRISYVKGSQFALSPFLGMREKGFSIVNERVRSKILKFEPRIFKKSLLAARFPYSPSEIKRIFEVNRNLKNFLCQATEQEYIIWIDILGYKLGGGEP